MKRASANADHVYIDCRDQLLKCGHCGASVVPPWGTSVRGFVRFCDGFGLMHESCVKPEEQK